MPSFSVTVGMLSMHPSSRIGLWHVLGARYPCRVNEIEWLTAKKFHAEPGVEDWRGLFWGAFAFYRVGTFAEGSRFVAAIADAAASVGHDPDVDLRPDGVTIRTATRPDGRLSRTDAVLAARISEAARALGLASEPAQLQMVGIAVAQDAGMDTRPFWAAALGLRPLGEEDAIDPQRRGPHLWFHELDAAQAGPRTRAHRRIRPARDRRGQSRGRRRRGRPGRRLPRCRVVDPGLAR